MECQVDSDEDIGEDMVMDVDMPELQRNQDRKRKRIDVKGFEKRSIFLAGNRIGIPFINEEVCELVSKELFHKTRELIFIAKIILHQNKRDVLTTEDVQKAMKLVGGIQLYGHSFEDDPTYVLKQKEKVYIEADDEYNLFNESLTVDKYYHNGDPYMQGCWIIPDGKPELLKPEGVSSYYEKISKTLMLGYTTHKRVALLDLRTNPKIGPECPYFLNLVAFTVKNAAQNDQIITTMIDTIGCIADNKYVDPSPFLAVNRAVNSLLKIVIEKNIEKSNCDDLPIRLRAGLLLSKVMILWSIELNQQIDVVRRLLQHFSDNTAPFQIQYGAIVTLTALGQRTLDFHYWPVIERYLLQLENRAFKRPDPMTADPFIVYSQYIMGALLVSLSCAFKKLFTTFGDFITIKDEKWQGPSSFRKGNTSMEHFEMLITMDKRIYAIFGDSVTPLRMLRHTNIPPTYIIKPEKRPNLMPLKYRKQNFPFQRTKKYNVQYEFEPTLLKKYFEIKFRDRNEIHEIKRPPALYYYPKPIKQYYFYVPKTLKTTKLHKNCCSGNLLANL